MDRTLDTAVPRIAFEALDPVLAGALAPRVERLGYLGDFFQCAAHQPRALLAFTEFSRAAQEALGKRLTQLVALTVSCARGDEYERNQHERLCVRLGLGRDWVAAVERLQPTAAPLDESERDAQSITLAMLDEPEACPELVRSYAARHGAAAAVALLLVVGRYLAHAAVSNAFAVAAPVPSIFEDGFDGD